LGGLNGLSELFVDITRLTPYASIQL
jgi:hypothetical protein